MERQELITQKEEAEKAIITIQQEQKELQQKILKTLREEIPLLERKSGDFLASSRDYEEVNDLIGKKKRQTRSMDASIGAKETELANLRQKVEALEYELNKLPKPKPEEPQ